jgi:hypothetical protein
MRAHTSTPGTLQRQWGGVGRNIAESCVRCGVGLKLISAVGEAGESVGDSVIKECAALGMVCTHILLL